MRRLTAGSWWRKSTKRVGLESRSRKLWRLVLGAAIARGEVRWDGSRVPLTRDSAEEVWELGTATAKYAVQHASEPKPVLHLWLRQDSAAADHRQLRGQYFLWAEGNLSLALQAHSVVAV